MADEFGEHDESTLKQMLEEATEYEHRQKIRKAIRAIKKAEGRAPAKKKTGTAEYRRMGTFQSPKQMTIPNSVTGNVLPDKVVTEGNKTEKLEGGMTISYLNATTTQPPRGYGTRNVKEKSGPMASAKIPIGRESPSAYKRRSPLNSSGQSPRSSPRPSVSSTQSITPEPPKSPEPSQEVDGELSPEPIPREPTPEPVREPTPEPPREPTPEPPREPTPEPVREPTPEPPREPTPEPPREPTPEPPREPTPEPPKEPTPEPELVPRSPTPTLKVDVEQEGDESEEEEGDEEDEEDDEEEEEGEGEEEEEGKDQEYQSTYSAQGKDIDVIKDVTVVAEPGVEGGDFRTRLRAGAAKIDTKAAFPQAKTKGAQKDFRDVLKNRVTVEKKTYQSGSKAQTDFREQLKKRTSIEPPPVEAKPSRQRDQDEEEEREKEEEAADDEEPPEAEEKVQEEEVEETDSVTASSTVLSPEPEADYGARAAARRAQRQNKSADRESKSKSPRPLANGTVEKPQVNGTEEKTSDTGSAEPDSYEARREARRKAREERMKAAAAKMEEKKEPRLTYRERKAREQQSNARDNRKKWENREEESGDKEKAGPPPPKNKDSATHQLLAWCQHKTKYYENVNIKDFRQSWSDGLAFCAILHTFLPDKIPYDDLSPDNPRRNFTIAFQAAKDEGIPEMLDVDDMVMVKIPDSKSIMTFLVTIYQHFN